MFGDGGDRLSNELLALRDRAKAEAESARPKADDGGQAEAWVAVYRECLRLGMSVDDGGLISGKDRVLAFIRRLHRQTMKR